MTGQQRRWTALAGAVCLAATLAVGRASGPTGVFMETGDVGTVKVAGSTTFDDRAQAYTLRGSGANMWAGADEFQFAWRRIGGAVILQARLEFLGAGAHPHRKAGLMIRASLDPGSPHVNVSRHGDGLTAIQFRTTPGGPTEEIRFDGQGQDVLQLERKGDTYVVSVARFGEVYVRRELTGVRLGESACVGLFICSHVPEAAESAVFRNVRLIRPVREGFVPYRDYIGSTIERLGVGSGIRRELFHADDSVQAPNWAPSPSRLLVNRNGRIYAFDLGTRTLDPIETGTVTRNNNDHALSFDGTMLGLSAGSPSVVYTVPARGGTPVQITPVGPSYLHSWSPDGAFLVFTGQRDGDYDIFRVPATGGPEVRLTDAPGLDDGPEYTPDGRWIYFNSTRTGRMQVWRMRPDGSVQTQLTFDDFNNWFPHISPDGRTVAFMSYGPEIRPDDHPWYKQVYIRTLPLDGGTPRVVAYVYGGQGSMNVNSWSPDSRDLAFVSNTGTY
jgi:TolB protein